MQKFRVSIIEGKSSKRPKGLLATLRRSIAAAMTAMPLGAITIVLAGGWASCHSSARPISAGTTGAATPRGGSEHAVQRHGVPITASKGAA